MRSQTIPNPRSVSELKADWERIAGENPHSFTSTIAHELGVSEAELLATKIGNGTTRLKKTWVEILGQLGALGEAKSITRNECAVLEKNGQYPEFEHFGVHSMFVSEDIDLRISLNEWHFGLAVRSFGRGGIESRSLQFFAKDGTAVHKLFLLPESDGSAYQELVTRFAAEDQSEGEQFSQAERKEARLDSEIDRDGLLEAWGALEDTHGFFGLLHRFGTTRPQAMRLAKGRFTRLVSNGCVRDLLMQVSREEVPVMFFVGNKGCLQIYKGVPRNVAPAYGWLNVMDTGSEMHLKEEQVAETWVVEKPTSDGKIRSLEMFDANGSDVLSIFGVRTEGKRQSAEWHASLDRLAADEYR